MLSSFDPVTHGEFDLFSDVIGLRWKLRKKMKLPSIRVLSYEERCRFLFQGAIHADTPNVSRPEPATRLFHFPRVRHECVYVVLSGLCHLEHSY